MKIERLYADPGIAKGAGADRVTLQRMQDALTRAVAQGMIEAYRHARDLQVLDPDTVMAEVEKYFGADGAWRDFLTDAFWNFEMKSRQDEGDHAPPHWSEAGR